MGPHHEEGHGENKIYSLIISRLNVSRFLIENTFGSVFSYESKEHSEQHAFASHAEMSTFIKYHSVQLQNKTNRDLNPVITADLLLWHVFIRLSSRS